MGMIQVSEKQPQSLAEEVQKMPPDPGRMLVLPRAERRSRGGGGSRAPRRGPQAQSQRRQGRPRRKLFALDFVPVFLLQRPGKTQRGVN